MPKLTLDDITSGYASITQLNDNFAAIETAIENTVSRDGTTPNQMTADLDMNSFRILNQANAVVFEGFNWEGDWATATPYVVGDIVVNAGSPYICVIAHTSGVFATDATAGYWQILVSANLPDQSGNTDKYLQTNGTSAVWSTPDASEVTFTQDGANAVERAVEDKIKEVLSVEDFSTEAAALAEAAASAKVIHVHGSATPAGSSGKDIVWKYVNGGSSDNVLYFDGTRGGYFADYECKAGEVLVGQFNENQTGVAGGGFRETLFVSAVDNDVNNYTAVGQKITGAVRGIVQGAFTDLNGYEAQYKDFHGGYFVALANVQWEPRGCSGVLGAAIQMGSGIASNEFAALNPDAPSGGKAQSKSMAAIQAIMYSDYADENPTHISRAVLIDNAGRRISFGIQMVSNTTRGYSGQYKQAISMSGATVTEAAIVMPQSASGNEGTVIEYDTNDYSAYYRSTNQFVWVVGGDVKLSTNQAGITLGGTTNSTKTRLYIESSTTGISHLQLYPGATPSAPNNGELWFDGTDVKMAVGGTIKTFTLT